MIGGKNKVFVLQAQTHHLLFLEIDLHVSAHRRRGVNLPPVPPGLSLPQAGPRPVSQRPQILGRPYGYGRVYFVADATDGAHAGLVYGKLPFARHLDDDVVVGRLSQDGGVGSSRVAQEASFAGVVLHAADLGP